MDLKDKTAIVTGGARGIGRGIALELAKAGANIVVADLPAVADDVKETCKLVEAEGAQAISVQTDVRVFADCQAMAQAAVDKFGSIDILVNNAGVVGVAPVVTMSEEEWDRVIGVNLTGMFLASKACIPQLVQRDAGRIVNLSSMAGKKGAPGLAHYCASKFGVIGFTQSLALELGGANVTVNAICPGEVDSNMWRDVLLPALGGEGEEAQQATFDRFIRERVPLGRPQTVEDIGQAAVFLCQADNITGESINVTGGSEMG